jgi:hypothetical protein
MAVISEKGRKLRDFPAETDGPGRVPVDVAFIQTSPPANPQPDGAKIR